ncbi:bifunctional riboflavin kinase/FAD synthetase [Chloroflexus sp.]|uniref:bifunctional riboflavin kinase/FAD synthetase n=1 Tax=Chloroflexus sp. TaxID=1904827 RepID=UPI002ACE27A0|nr:bifunctional riboflavin kinase/FAD synthetase [Chloroflexus sp.]
MQIARDLTPGLANRATVLTIGRFDGVHLGHQQLIRTTVERARALDMLSAVLTWEPHPRAVLQPGQPLQLLSDLDEKIEQIRRLEPDLLIIAPFTEEIRRMAAVEYMARISAALPVREIWVGEDFAMGRGREGDIPRLMEIGRELGFAVGALSKYTVAGIPVSSSRIRELVLAGNVAGAGALLGRPFALRGIVIHGDGRGRQIGFPTANVQVSPDVALPANGVYACRAYLATGEVVPAVTNIGIRPTFNGMRRVVEAYLLDWEGDLYDQPLRLELLMRLRNERKFNGIDELVAQIHHDVAEARAVLGVPARS